MINSKFIRIISLLGIILLLSLQYIWLRKAYQMVERDIMEKSKQCLKEAMDEDLFKRLGQNTFFTGVSKSNSNIKECLSPKTEVLATMDVNNAKDLNIGVQDLLNNINRPCAAKCVDSIFQKKIFDQLGFIPKHELTILDDSTKLVRNKNLKTSRIPNLLLKSDSHHDKDSCKVYDHICDNTIFVKLDSNHSMELVLTSPVSTIISRAKYIFIISLLLVFLIGIILIFQYKNMKKNKEFTAYMKDYTRIIAHEMKTPVNSIYLISSRLMSEKSIDTEKTMLYYKENLNQCQKLLLNIDNILMVAKAEQSSLSIYKREIDMSSFIEKIVDRYRNNHFQLKNINIETLYKQKECVACIDKDLMENVFINLIENAIKYSRDSVEILISCSVENNSLLLKIKDNGLGINEKNLYSIFKIFERGMNPNSNKVKGFGIGLYYVQKVVAAHKGKINIISEEGKGSEFIIEIPNLPKSNSNMFF